MPYVIRNGRRRARPAGASNGVQYLVALDGTKATFECKSGHRSVKDYGKGPAPKRIGEDVLRKFATYWGLGLQTNGTRGHCYGWCQSCQDETDAAR